MASLAALLLLAAGLVQPGMAFTVTRLADLSKTDSWRCGLFLVSAVDGLPRATYFVFQQHLPATCPAKKSCSERGAAWAGSWDPLQAGGTGGRNGDRVCQIAATELRASNIPNKEFPMGLQIAALYNHCGREGWRRTKFRRSERICCQDGSFVECKGRLGK